MFFQINLHNNFNITKKEKNIFKRTLAMELSTLGGCTKRYFNGKESTINRALGGSTYPG